MNKITILSPINLGERIVISNLILLKIPRKFYEKIKVGGKHDFKYL
jgi:hypothetical protein